MLRLEKRTPQLTTEDQQTLETMWQECTSDILHCTSLAACGHPGGSMSSLNLLLMTYAFSNISPENVLSDNRDRVIVSHGHISPAVYAVLSQYGFFDREEMILNFRKTGSKFSGHVEDGVPGVEWNTGNLGQGISAACGLALAQKKKNIAKSVYVFMGDGEQQKGQIAEACRFAIKYKLNNLVAIIDVNRMQIGGATSDIMDQDLAALYKALQWNVLEVRDGHDNQTILEALQQAQQHHIDNPEAPTVILAHTIMGKGVSFMSDIYDFHGKSCSIEEHAQAMEELGLPNKLKEFQDKKAKLAYKSSVAALAQKPTVNINLGQPIVYNVDAFTDNRSAYGAALNDLAKLNNSEKETTKIVGFSCDLEGSVKMSPFRKTSPDYFFEGGIQEHNTAVVAGAMSKEDFQVFFSTFGVFGVDEVYNQQRLNGFNHTNIKTVCTHLGLSVGEDGPTHQSIDYVGLLRNVFGYQILISADPNQTDHMVRYAASIYGNVFIGMGRAKTPVIANQDNQPYFGSDYQFEIGKADLLKEGNQATLITYGPLLAYTLEAAKKLEKTHNCLVSVLNMGSLAPCDEAAIISAAKDTGHIITIEDHHVDTGLGSIVASVLTHHQLAPRFKALGIDRFSYSGQPSELYKEHGLDTDNIVATVLELRK